MRAIVPESRAEAFASGEPAGEFTRRRRALRERAAETIRVLRSQRRRTSGVKASGRALSRSSDRFYDRSNLGSVMSSVTAGSPQLGYFDLSGRNSFATRPRPVCASGVHPRARHQQHPRAVGSLRTKIPMRVVGLRSVAVRSAARSHIAQQLGLRWILSTRRPQVEYPAI